MNQRDDARVKYQSLFITTLEEIYCLEIVGT